MKMHPAAARIGKLTPEEIDKLATHLVKTGAPLPHLPSLNPALHALQVMRAAKGGGKNAPPVPIPGDASNSIPKPPPSEAAPVAPRTGPAPSMAAEGVAQGMTGGNPARGRNPFTAYGSN